MKEALLKSRPFRYLDMTQLNTLLTYCKVLSFAPGDIILKQGKENDRMYIIISGTAITLARMLGKGMVPISALKEGDFVGEGSLLEKELSTSTVIAESATTCILITQDYFNTLAVVFPEIKYKISRAIVENICDRLQLLFNQIKGHLDKEIVSSWYSFNEIIQSFIKTKPIDFSEVEKEQILHMELFNKFNSNELTELMNYMKLVTIPNKHTLIYKDDKDTSSYIIVHGAVEAAINKDDKRLKLSVLGPGVLFGGAIYCSGFPTAISYSTREHTVLLEFTADKLDELRNNNIQIWYQFYNLICQSLIEMEKSAAKLYIRLNSETVMDD